MDKFLFNFMVGTLLQAWSYTCEYLDIALRYLMRCQDFNLYQPGPNIPASLTFPYLVLYTFHLLMLFQINMEEINAIASAPSSSHVFKLDSFDDLTDTLVEQLVHYACTADEGSFIQLWTISVLVIIILSWFITCSEKVLFWLNESAW